LPHRVALFGTEEHGLMVSRTPQRTSQAYNADRLTRSRTMPSNETRSSIHIAVSLPFLALHLFCFLPSSCFPLVFITTFARTWA
jgi:hypothetical protein